MVISASYDLFPYFCTVSVNRPPTMLQSSGPTGTDHWAYCY